jgi:LysM repeat protein
MLLMAGCFRPAGEQPLVEETLIESVDTSGSSPDPAASPSIVPENVNPLEGSDDLSITQIPLLVPTLTATFTPGVVASLTPQPTSQAQSQLTLESNPSLVFITPGRPLDFLATDTPSNTPIPNEIINITPNASGELDPETAFGIPNSTPDPLDTAGAPSFSSAAEGTAECIYIVEPGDTLFGIAIAMDVLSADIRRMNPELVGTNPLLQIGQELNMPFEDCPGYIPPPPTEESTAEAESTSDAAEGLIGGNIYIVEPGDTLFNIATRFGLTVADLVAANDLVNPNQLSIGQELIIPMEDDG